MASAEIHLSTIGSGVATTFEQEGRSHFNDQNHVMASIEYVGWIEKILELDYGKFQTIILLCNWVVANHERSTTTIKHDEYGFTLVNFEQLIPLLAQSFAFPMHIKQVFFVEDARSPRNWKVVLRMELRG
jgi:hypothetical protein